MGFEPHQLRIAEITAKCSGTLSIIGSSSIILEIWRRGRHSSGGGSNNTTHSTSLHKLLLGMSIFDIGASSMYVVGSWAIPSDAEGNQFQPSGTDRTCVAQGALFQTFASAIPMYNLSLAVYYYLTVNHSWKEDRLRKWQWAFHVLPVSFGTCTATYGIVADQFNPNELWCWFSGTAQSDMLKFLLYYGPLWVVFFVICVLFSLIYRHVRRQEVAKTMAI